MARALMLGNIKNLTCYLHFWQAISIRYAAIMSQNRDLVIIWSTLNWLDLISTEKKHGKQRWSIKMIAPSQLFTVC